MTKDLLNTVLKNEIKRIAGCEVSTEEFEFIRSNVNDDMITAEENGETFDALSITESVEECIHGWFKQCEWCGCWHLPENTYNATDDDKTFCSFKCEKDYYCEQVLKYYRD